MQVQTTSKTALTINEIIGRGGEATIHNIHNQTALAAKLYHEPSRDHEQKLQAMMVAPPRQTSGSTHTPIAWPRECLYNQGRFVGFVMPKINDSSPIFNYYNPSKRSSAYPGFNWRYLHRTARNLAAVVASVHQSRHVIGDINESNVLVNNSALVSLVDTDSFQIEASDGTLFHCPVGKAEFMPPELQGESLSDTKRTEFHDRFGLAVLLFRLLMEGYHPFAAVLQDETIQERVDLFCIREGIFPYATNYTVGQRFSKKHQQATPPPKAPPLQMLHPAIRRGFQQTFVMGYRHPEMRLSASEWKLALTKAEQALITCKNDHVFSEHTQRCPWCGALPQASLLRQSTAFVRTLPSTISGTTATMIAKVPPDPLRVKSLSKTVATNAAKISTPSLPTWPSNIAGRFRLQRGGNRVGILKRMRQGLASGILLVWNWVKQFLPEIHPERIPFVYKTAQTLEPVVKALFPPQLPLRQWSHWILVQSLGWVGGLGVAWFIYSLVSNPNNDVLNSISVAIALSIAGLVLGLAQWRSLRKVFVDNPRATAWVGATAAGALGGALVGQVGTLALDALPPLTTMMTIGEQQMLINTATIGAGVGYAQWRLVLRHAQFWAQAYWWPLVNILGPLAFVLGLIWESRAGAFASLIAYGATTGYLLNWLPSFHPLRRRQEWMQGGLKILLMLGVYAIALASCWSTP
ncbi:MAG: hypothetical protein AAF639_14640 [Chloroflexota bacterium]